MLSKKYLLFKNNSLNPKRIILVVLLLFNSFNLNADSFKFNNYNNHGVVGLVNMPTARHFDESIFGATLYGGSPDTRLTFTSSPFEWLEASLYYTRIKDRPYCEREFDDACRQSYKDKGFNFKVRLRKEDKFPAVSLGINDLGGTGLYSSEYIVASYGINNLDLHFGLGWGALNGSKYSFENPLIKLSNKFASRSILQPGDTGKFDAESFFSGKKVSPFFGFSYLINEKTLLKFEHDSTRASGSELNYYGSTEIGYERSKYDFSFGIDYHLNKNFSIGLFHERGNTTSIKFVYKQDAISSNKYATYRSANTKVDEDKYSRLRKNLRNNGIGVNKIVEGSSAIGLELTQFVHPNIQVIEEIIKSATIDSGINKEVKTNIKIADLQAYEDYDLDFEKQSQTIFLRKKVRSYNSNTGLSFRPFLASREEFFKGAILIENNFEYILADNLFFSSNLKYSLADNFDDLRFPPEDTFPAQVRSDVKDYLRNFDNGILIGRAQLDGYQSLSKNDHFMFSVGIFEEMFTGYGFEYLHSKNDSSHAYGVEIFEVHKRDYDLRFDLLDYNQTTAHFNYYFRNYGSIPFDLKASFGKYLAGDFGSTIEISRSYRNGVKFGVFVTLTDVSSEEFGEGSFDKGIFFNIPIFSNLVSYSWRPLTKDPGQKLIRKNTLHDLLIKFKPIN